MAANFESLPVELLLKIAESADPRDLAALILADPRVRRDMHSDWRRLRYGNRYPDSPCGACGKNCLKSVLATLPNERVMSLRRRKGGFHRSHRPVPRITPKSYLGRTPSMDHKRTKITYIRVIYDGIDDLSRETLLSNYVHPRRALESGMLMHNRDMLVETGKDGRISKASLRYSGCLCVPTVKEHAHTIPIPVPEDYPVIYPAIRTSPNFTWVPAMRINEFGRIVLVRACGYRQPVPISTWTSLRICACRPACRDCDEKRSWRKRIWTWPTVRDVCPDCLLHIE